MTRAPTSGRRRWTTTWSASIGRQDVGASTGAYFQDGAYLYLARGTFLPIYECEGRHLMHLGVSGGYQKSQANLGNPPASRVGDAVGIDGAQQEAGVGIAGCRL